MKLSLFLFVLVVSLHAQRYEPDRVTGMSIPYSHPWYSGYLNISSDKAFHYVFFQSQHDPDNDPVLLWLNGGPGCSSLIGMSYENGPFKFHTNKTSMFMSNHSWNKEANLLYIESPGSVGFSIGPVASSDHSVQQDNLRALIQFFAMYPTFRKNSFYISGESYAGIYVPYLAMAIHEYNQHTATAIRINLKGLIVGNACTRPDECSDIGLDGTSMFQYEFLYRRTFYSEYDYQRLRAACVMAFHSDYCREIRKELDKQFQQSKTSILNIYSKCYYQNISEPSETNRLSLSRSSGLLADDALDCDDSMGAYHFFNDDQVRAHLHVAQRFNLSQKWFPCSDEVQLHYTMDQNASYHMYPILMRAGYRVWVYSGDVDADVPITGTLSWLQKLREQFHVKIERPWREWWVHGKNTHEDQVGGMIWQLSNLTFVSVKGAGHMVPRDKPQAASVIINGFLKGQDLPEKAP